MQRRLLRLLEGIFGEGMVEFELSMRVGDEVPIPDLVVFQSHSPRMYRDVLDEPPLLCIEVVSPSQLPAEMLAKCERYRAFGVPFCGVVDPVSRRAWEYHRRIERFSPMTPPREVTEALTGPCTLPLPAVFAE
jgi:Uma2 family endonuclease